MALRTLLPLALLAGVLSAAPPGRMDRRCAACHTAGPGEWFGTLDRVVTHSRTLQARQDGSVEVFHYDPATLSVASDSTAETPEGALKGLGRDREIRVAWTEAGGAKVAGRVAAKPLYHPAEAEVASEEAVARLAAGHARGLLVDVRPPEAFDAGSLPSAVNLPLAELQAHPERLPADRSLPIVLLCESRTCPLAAAALARMRALGFRDVRVFPGGLSAWSLRQACAVSPEGFRRAFLDAGEPVIILDLRPAAELREGFLPGTVAVAPKDLPRLLADAAFPGSALNPAVLVVDATGGADAAAAAGTLVQAGYTRTSVLAGGFRAWRKAGLPVRTGAPATLVTWSPRLKPGAVPPAEFTRLASLPPSARGNVVIVDVRSRGEAKQGMIAGALNVPLEELESHLPELPRDRRLLLHCKSGARAEMAYHLLKARGYDVGFLDDGLTILATGEFVTD